jgi:peptidyl-prolyl cis-trans isomerase SurA
MNKHRTTSVCGLKSDVKGPWINAQARPLIFLLLCSLAVFSRPAAASELIDRIVAVVNDDIVLLSELRQRIEPYRQQIQSMGYSMAQQQQMLFKVRDEIIDRLIDEKLTDQQVAQRQIVVSDSEVDASIERIKEMRAITDEQLRAALDNQGVAMDAYRQQVREQLLRSKLLDYEIKSKIVITESDIKTYYDEHRKDYAGEKKYHLRNIIMRVPAAASQAEKAAVYARMESVRSELSAGADFPKMARTYSESSLAADGGDLGLFRLDELAPILQPVIESTAPGTFTPILDTDQGYQIFFVQRIVETPPKPIETVSREIEKKLYDAIVDEKFKEWLDSLRQQSHIKVIQ